MKLKINKKTGLIAGVVIFLAAAGYLGMTTIQKVDEKNTLQTQLTTAQTRLQGIKLESLSSQPAELQNQLNLLSDNLTEVKAKLSDPISSTNATEAVIHAATNNNLTVTKVTSSDPTNQSVQGITLSTISITATVEGNISKIIDFIAELNSQLKPSAIKSVEITVPQVTNSGNITAGVTDNATANIEIGIYVYLGE